MFSKTATRVTTNMCLRTSGKITNHTVCNNLLQDSRPYHERRVDAKLCEQDVAQGFKDRWTRVKDDTRPYHERRVDAKLCEQDVAQGFKDRRLREIVINMSIRVRLIAPALDGIVRYAPMTTHPNEPNEPSDDDEKEIDFDIRWGDELARRSRLTYRLAIEKERARVAEEEQIRLRDIEKERARVAEEEAQRQLRAEVALVIKTPVKSSITQNPAMVIKMRHWFGYKLNGCSVVSDEFYQEHIQFIRDQISFDQESQEPDQIMSDQIVYGTQMQPQRRRRIIVDL
jgi:hypothetical protein